MDTIRQKTDCISMWEPPSNARVAWSSYDCDTQVKQWREGKATETIHITLARINSPLSQQTEDNYLTFIDAALALGAYT